jgi:hypothetical protein
MRNTMDCSTVGCNCPSCVNVRETCSFALLMRRVPVPLFEKIHARLLVPFLAHFSELAPALFPREWTVSPPLRGRKGDSLQWEFYYMCVMAAGWRTLVYDGYIDAARMLHTLTSRGDNLLSWLTLRGRADGAGPAQSVLKLRIRLQVWQIRGVDSIYFRLFGEVLAIVHSIRAPSLDAMVQLAADAGMVARMQSLASDFCVKFAGRNCAVVDFMTQLGAALQPTERVAVAMALHPRLGGASPLAMLGPDLLPLCLPRAREPLLGWRDMQDE